MRASTLGAPGSHILTQLTVIVTRQTRLVTWVVLAVGARAQRYAPRACIVYRGRVASACAGYLVE